jgi:N utilization substance protein A
MNQNLLTIMKQLLSQKGLPKEILVEAIEAALLQAAKRRYGSIQSVKVKLDDATGAIEVLAPKRVVEIMRSYATEIPIEEAVKVEPGAQIGDVIEAPVETKDFGRIEAQIARQILAQKIRDAERANIFNLYKDHIEDIVSGVVQQYEYRDVIVEIDSADAVLPASEQLRTEQYRRGDRIRALIVDVLDPSNTEQTGRRYRAPVVLSRAHPVLLVRLFEQEVPEILDGLVQIMAIARDPGERSKVAVASTEEGIDAVGTCVGVRGSRVQMVVRELNGERVDVLPWNPDPAIFVANALGQAKVSDVVLGEDEEGEPLATVIVPEEQLSLAIGKRGQNARLASQLTGWKIDIVGEREAGADLRSRVVAAIFKTTDGAPGEAQEQEEYADPAEMPVTHLAGVGPKMAQTLRANDYPNVGAVAQAQVAELAKLPNFGQKSAEKLVQLAQGLLQKREREAAERLRQSQQEAQDEGGLEA